MCSVFLAWNFSLEVRRILTDLLGEWVWAWDSLVGHHVQPMSTVVRHTATRVVAAVFASGSLPTAHLVSVLCKDKVQPETLAGRGFVEEEAPLQNVLQREVLAAKLVRWKDLAMLTLGNDFPETELATEFGNRLFRYLPILPYRDCS